MTGPRRVAIALSIVTALAACSPGASDEPSPTERSSRMQLKVMEFNVEYGGTEVDFDGVIEAIRASDADIVGIEEGYGNMPRIASEVGWNYYDPATQILSRFPLLAPPESDGLYTFVAVRPGRVVAIANVHLPSTRYGPFQINRHDASEKDVLSIERNLRLPALEPTLDAASGLAADGIPTFLVGDFNAPSHLDWTQEAVGVREHVKFPVRWPVSLAVERAGFVDSYREANPDPVADPGLTWPAKRPFVKGYNPGRNGAEADRIDFVYSGGPAKVLDSALVGEEGGPGVEIPVSPWPTDHRATVSTFEVMPAEPPTLVAVEQRLLDVGDEVLVRFHAPGDAGERVVVAPAGGDAATDVVAEQPTGDGSPTDGAVNFSTQGWESGAYEAALVEGSGAELSRTPFWVRKPGARPEIGTVKRTYDEGEPIEVEWRLAPGNRWDWIGIYKRGANPNIAYYIMWVYTGATVEGSTVFDDDAHGPWPLEPGQYSVYLLQDDGYDKLAGGVFSVRG
jgi:hypothetical protein